MITKRDCISPKDIQLIKGRSERYGRKLLQTIKDAMEKEPHQFVTTKEFSEHPGIELDVVNTYIKD